MSVTLAPPPFLQFLNPNNSGSPAVDFQIFTYQAGTNTKQATWTDSTQTSQNLNPMPLDGNGVGTFWGDPALAYKLVWAPANDTDPPSSPIRTVDNFYFPATIGALATTTSVPISPDKIRTAAEIAANVTPTNYSYPPLNLLRYGADSTGVSPCDTAFNNAVAVCGSAGGTIRAPAGIYSFASANTALNAKTSIVIQGDGAATGGATAATKFQFTGTGAGVWFSMNSAVGVQFRGIQFVHTQAGFTGTYFQNNNDGSHGDPHDCGLFDCTVGSNVGTGTIHLDLNKCILFRAERCEFSYGNPSVSLAKAAGYSNVITFRDCTWASNYVTPIQNIASSAQTVLFDGCSFENLTTGALGALSSAASTAIFDGVTFSGCWFGDATVNSGSWIDIYGAGLSFTGNYLSGGASAFGTGITLRQFAGASIKGNVITNLVNGLNLAVANCNNIEIAECPLNNVTNFVINGNNAPMGQLIWYPNFGVTSPPSSNHGIYASPGFEPNPDGTIEAWGSATVTTGTPLAVTYAGAGLPNMPNSTLTVQLTLASPSGTTNSVYLSGALATTGFTINVGGTAGTSTVLWRAKGV